jgi:hypothetical protein
MNADGSRYRTHEADSPYHRTLPIGDRLDGSPLVEDSLSCFDSVALKALEPMLVPEEPRHAVGDPESCGHCKPSPHTIWADDLWHVNAGWTRMGIPYVGGLAPNRHCTLDTAPLDVLTSLGPLMQRINIAVKSIPGVARTHFARWGDGSEHFHLWALARPAGMMQGRGPMLAFWDDVLPAMPDELMAEHLRIVAENLAAGGGTAFPHRDQGVSP